MKPSTHCLPNREDTPSVPALSADPLCLHVSHHIPRRKNLTVLAGVQLAADIDPGHIRQTWPGFSFYVQGTLLSKTGIMG